MVYLFDPTVLLVVDIQEIHADQEKIVKISAAAMQCSASVDVLFLLDGSYSIGKGSFERSKHFMGKLCDALDIRPDRVSFDFAFPMLSSFRGGSTETGLALKYILRKGFPGGRNSTVPEILIILSDGKSQGNTEIPATQLKERRIMVFAVGIKFPRWEELQALASDPAEQHVLFAGDAADAANGFYSTLTRSAVCSAPAPDCKIESYPCERKTLETVKDLSGNFACWRGSKQQSAVHGSLCPFYRWKKVFIKHPSRRFRTVCPDPCDSQPCQNGGTCVSEGLVKFYCLCPVGYGADVHCGPKLSLECSVDLLFLMDSSAGIALEGFLRFKAFLKRFLQAVMGQESPMNVGVAQYDTDVKIPIEVGQHKDVFGLMKSIEALNFSGGETQTGRALWYIAQHGFRSIPALADVQDDLPRVAVLLTDSKSQDPVVEAAKYARDQGLFLIGIGRSFLRAELTEVTGNPTQTIIYSSPQDLLNKIPELQKRICSMDSPEGCQAQSLDLVFVVDASAGVGLENFLLLRDFVRSGSSHFSISRDVTQIGLVVYSSRAHTAFALDTHTSNSSLLQAINQLPFLGGSSSPGSALLHIHGDVMTVHKGARPGVNKVVVMLTNGGGMEDAASPARQLRNNGILVFVVGSVPEPAVLLVFIAEAKSPANLCKPNPCLNQGLCVLGPGSHRCECHSWQGPHCATYSPCSAPSRRAGTHFIRIFKAFSSLCMLPAGWLVQCC
uniref:von Willebrand factor A domain containing 2 n=1 Tax=Nothoprocta perdicaria TaxID=30464 RepID=A0A8C6ZY46_NOTPE